ncbi:DUF3040 domain-containing protein [Saccharothrix syringae]|uniref:DUF3040 domain-containing protein n=1 Tax=Saccharothrix syringae TaxID=103733 RepID=UPI000A6000ED|nr:DUF3040 domain-containing protein [Saccharothrix syringae]
MLSERDREALLDIERRLTADDPDFERSFRALDEVAPARRPRPASVVAAAAAVLAVVVLAAGSPTGALAYAVIAGLVWLVRDLPDTPAQDG